MPWAVAAAAITAGAGIYSASEGASAQEDAANKAIAGQQENRQFSQDFAEKQFKPYLDSGTDALGSLKTLMGGGQGSLDFLRNMPGYQFQMDQGEEAVLNSASARGGVAGGNTLRELTKFGQGLADQSIWKYIAQLTQQAQMGQNAAGTVTGDVLGVSGNTTNNIGNVDLQKGNVGAAQSVSTGTSIGNMFKNPDVIDALKGINWGGATDYSNVWVV